MVQPTGEWASARLSDSLETDTSSDVIVRPIWAARMAIIVAVQLASEALKSQPGCGPVT